MAEDTEQLALFDLGVDVGALRKKAQELRANATAEATLRAYDSDWRIFAAWCAAAGRQALPAHPDTVQLFLVHELQTRKPATVERRLAAIAAKHRQNQMSRPVTDELRDILHGYSREHGSRPASKRALTPAEIRAMVKSAPATAAGLRDQALLTFGFSSGLRRSDLARLDLRDLTFGREGIRVFVRRGKTDQAGKGREIGIFAGQHEHSDPLRWLERYLEVRGMWPGALFVRALPNDPERLSRYRLSADYVGVIVQQAAARIGLDPREYGAHSLRAGCVTAAVEMGVPESLIMQRTGHRSHQTLSRYVRPARVLSVDVLAGAL